MADVQRALANRMLDGAVPFDADKPQLFEYIEETGECVGSKRGREDTEALELYGPCRRPSRTSLHMKVRGGLLRVLADSLSCWGVWTRRVGADGGGAEAEGGV